MPRVFVLIAALALPALAGPALSLAAPEAATAPTVNIASTLAADRAGFGPSAALLSRLGETGAAAYLKNQTKAAPPAAPEALGRALAGFPLYETGPVDLFRLMTKPPGSDNPGVLVREAGVQALGARLARAALSPDQLREVMAGFWRALFLPDPGKDLPRLFSLDFERRAVTPRALGRFEDLLSDAVRHSAMLLASGNWHSSAPGGPGISGEPSRLDTALARTVLADVCLGSAKAGDIEALALILTGWGVGAPRDSSDANGINFDAGRHAKGTKHLLDGYILDTGREELAWAVSRIAAHPATARRVSELLARYFLLTPPNAALIDTMTAAWRAGDGDIGAVLAALFASRDFAASARRRDAPPDDFRFVALAARLLGPERFDYKALATRLADTGYPLFGRDPARPAGLTPLARKHLADQLCQGEMTLPGAPPAPPVTDAMLDALSDRLSDTSLRKLKALPETDRACAVLREPEIAGR